MAFVPVLEVSAADMTDLAAMKVVCIVGAGQLGSRHLQALRNLGEPVSIHVVDPSAEALRVAKERYEAVVARSPCEVSFDTGFEGLAGTVDVAIVATGARQRRRAVEALLAKADVRSLVLEKLLFTRRDDFAAVGELLRARGVQAWVDCSMRTMPFYASLVPELRLGPIAYQVTGSRFGLVTNAIHFVDHVAYYTGCHRFVVRTERLAAQPVPSKRAGYLEIDGTLQVDFEDGSQCTMTCYPAGTAPIVVGIQGRELRCVSRESEGKAWVSRAADGWRWQEVQARVPYQSEMTTGVVDELLHEGRCALAPYEESAPMHLLLLDPLKAFLDEKTGQTRDDEYPFT